MPSARILPASSPLVHPALNKLSVSDFSRDELHRETSRPQGLLTTRSEYDRLDRLHCRNVFTDNANVRHRDASPAAGITTTAITWCGKSVTTTRSAGTAGSMTAPGVCLFRTTRCLARSRCAGKGRIVPGKNAAGKRDAAIRIFSEPTYAGAIPGP